MPAGYEVTAAPSCLRLLEKGSRLLHWRAASFGCLRIALNSTVPSNELLPTSLFSLLGIGSSPPRGLPPTAHGGWLPACHRALPVATTLVPVDGLPHNLDVGRHWAFGVVSWFTLSFVWTFCFSVLMTGVSSGTQTPDETKRVSVRSRHYRLAGYLFRPEGERNSVPLD